MIFILGKTCSGKTTVVDELVKNYGFKKITTYTTRPPREGEVNHKDYHFIPKQEFLDKIKSDFFAEWKTYTTKYGVWYYGVSVQDLVNADDKSIIIITPDGFRDLLEKFNFNYFSIYIDCYERILRERLIKRGDNPSEASRRLKADNIDFKYVKKDVDMVIENNGNVSNVVKEIIRTIKQKDNIKSNRKIDNIFCDFDGVISNTIKCIVELYNEDFRYYKDFKPIHWTDINTWDFTECNCASKEYINTYFNQQRFFDRLKYMDWAKEVLDELNEYYNITIVTSGYSPNLKAKEIWVNENLPYCQFIGVNLKEYSDKSHIDMGKNSIFIDDSSHNLTTSSAEYKVCFGDIYDWNKNWDGKRCYNWFDIKRYINDINKKGERIC